MARRRALPLLEGKLVPYVAADVSGEGEEIWHGAPGLEGSNGRADLLVGGGLVQLAIATHLERAPSPSPMYIPPARLP